MASCLAPSNVDTTSAGSHTFTVQATDVASNTTSKTVNYTIDAPALCPSGQVGSPRGCTTPPGGVSFGSGWRSSNCTTPAAVLPRLSLPSSIAASSFPGHQARVDEIEARQLDFGQDRPQRKAIATARGKADKNGKATITVKLSKSTIKKIKRKSILSAQVQTVKVDGSPTVVKGPRRSHSRAPDRGVQELAASRQRRRGSPRNKVKPSLGPT